MREPGNVEIMSTESRGEPYPSESDPDFARGQDHEALPTKERLNQFSEGQEELPPDTPEKLHEGRFSEGQEELPPDTPEKLVEGRFSEGQEELPRRD
jgi:hypothetical protein